MFHGFSDLVRCCSYFFHDFYGCEIATNAIYCLYVFVMNCLKCLSQGLCSLLKKKHSFAQKHEKYRVEHILTGHLEIKLVYVWARMRKQLVYVPVKSKPPIVGEVTVGQTQQNQRLHVNHHTARRFTRRHLLVSTTPISSRIFFCGIFPIK